MSAFSLSGVTRRSFAACLGIHDPESIDVCPRREFMRLGAGFGEYVLDVYVSDEKGIAYKRTVAAPRYGFGAHDRYRGLLSDVDEFVYGLLKLWRLHVVRKAAKGLIAPTCIRRLASRVPESAERGHMEISNLSGFQRWLQICLFELWVVPRPGNRANIDEFPNGIGVQNR